MLHNDLYVGRFIWNKQRYVKDPRTGKRLARLNPESAWIVQEVPELRLIDQELWDRVQAGLSDIRESPAMKKAREKKFWLNRRPKHLLTGLLKCGCCEAICRRLAKTTSRVVLRVARAPAQTRKASIGPTSSGSSWMR